MIQSTYFSQGFTATEMAKMPMKISNNAVTGSIVNGKKYVYSFSGIDSTKNYTGINLKAFKYDVLANTWDTLPNLPDSRGKIAAGASTIDSIIYIVGGYHVYFGGNEVSSSKVHRFNVNTNTYLTDATPIPVAIDDHVQAVWKDSLLFVITGWSNSGNVPNVQIYSPISNSWSVGTSTPNNNDYKSFGASGTIVGNTIYYFGGASMGSNFPVQNVLRIGEINPANPTQITWRKRIPSPSLKTYRAACVGYHNTVHWLGGSETTYNYNGIAYNGTGGVSVSNKNVYYNLSDTILRSNPIYLDTIPMDLRGIATFGFDNYIAGGMAKNQKVTNKTYKLTMVFSGLNEKSNNKKSFQVFPNPAYERLNFKFREVSSRTIILTNILGKEVKRIKTENKTLKLEVKNLASGVYFIQVLEEKKNKTYQVRKIIIRNTFN